MSMISPVQSHYHEGRMMFISGMTDIRRSLPQNNASDFWQRSSSADDDDVGGADRGQCVWSLQGAGHCAHVLVPFGFAVTLTWICVLWIVVRVLRRRRSAVVADVSSSSSSSLCTCRSFHRRDVAWTTPACHGGNIMTLLFAPSSETKMVILCNL